MKINVTCTGCQRVMRVSEQHLGKKGKCPSCGTVNLLQTDPGLASSAPPQPGRSVPTNNDNDIPDAIRIPNRPATTPVAPIQPKQEKGFSLSSSDFNSPSDSPYQAPKHSGLREPENSSDADVPGILGVVAGGLSLLGLLFCVCLGPIVLGVLVISIAGLIVSFFGRPPLKAIGIGLNLAALAIILLCIIAIIAFYFFAISGGMPMP